MESFQQNMCFIVSIKLDSILFFYKWGKIKVESSFYSKLAVIFFREFLTVFYKQRQRGKFAPIWIKTSEAFPIFAAFATKLSNSTSKLTFAEKWILEYQSFWISAYYLCRFLMLNEYLTFNELSGGIELYQAFIKSYFDMLSKPVHFGYNLYVRKVMRWILPWKEHSPES